MALALLEHFTIRCRDMEKTRDFYRDVLGLPVGARPPLGFDGYWLYCGDTPAVHLVRSDDPKALQSVVSLLGEELALQPPGRRSGAVDHIAFRGTDPDAMMDRLEKFGVGYEHNVAVGGRLRQLFIQDPDGVVVELNFPDQDPSKPIRARTAS
jgi:catechol 2,3-dioxygenase-like lactoylglutathione lyase family enzyme